MLIIWLLTIGISFLYFYLLHLYSDHWHALPETKSPDSFIAQEGVTIVIIAHNEAATIGSCLEGILSQDRGHSRFEIIVVDDHSTDQTKEVVENLQSNFIHYFNLRDFPEYIHPPAFKKAGITLGVDQAHFENIVVTDADCLHRAGWLRSVLFSLENSGAVFQTAPVLVKEGSGLIEKMQMAEYLVFALITGAGIHSGKHYMANGANMAFKKSAFKSVHGYEGNMQYASGDDMFLAEKMSKAFPGKIAYAKSNDAVVWTSPKEDWSSLLQQRLRWAGKNFALDNKNILMAWWFVGIYHVCLVGAFIIALIHPIFWKVFILLLVAKWIADYMLLASAAYYFRQREILKFFVPLQIIYGWYLLRLSLNMLFRKKGDWRHTPFAP